MDVVQVVQVVEVAGVMESTEREGVDKAVGGAAVVVAEAAAAEMIKVEQKAVEEARRDGANARAMCPPQ
jgi:hypothetical protein